MWPLESRNVITKWPPLDFVCAGAAAAIERMLTLVFVFEPAAVEPPLVLREPTRVGPPVGPLKCGLLVVDNVFATPLLQKPLALGADVVVYSATKHIDGQGRCLGGAILASEKFVKDDLGLFYRHTGPSLSPFNAWLLLKGLETLELRVDRQCRTAVAVARCLETHPKITRVLYPGLPSHPQHDLARRQMKQGGSLVCFDVAGGKEGCFRFLDALRLVDISNNLGDSKSLVTHPATTTHSRLKPEARAELGISDALVRFSAGLEAEADLLGDIERALKQV